MKHAQESRRLERLLRLLIFGLIIEFRAPPGGDSSVGAFAADPEPADLSLTFSSHIIRFGYSYSYGLDTADLDGDGDLDLTSSDTRNFKLYWFENNGKGRFAAHFIENGDRLGILGDITGAAVVGSQPGEPINQRWFTTPRLERHRIGDVDGDGKPDVVIVENLHGDLYWYRNSGKPAEDELWRRFTITHHTIPGAYDVELADLDHDGDLDVAVSTWRLSNKFVWFENPGEPERSDNWALHLIEENIAEPRTIRVGDFNADGHADLLGTARVANQVMWYENPGDPRRDPWKKHLIDSNSPDPGHGMPADMDRDGDLDVVMALGMDSHANEHGTREIVWYENVGSPGRGSDWTKHVITGDFDDAFEAIAVDLDGDGHLDVAATSYADPGGGAFWFRNPGQPKDAWTKHVLRANWPRANQILAGDFDRDGRIDLVAGCTGSDSEVRHWRNSATIRASTRSDRPRGEWMWEHSETGEKADWSGSTLEERVGVAATISNVDSFGFPSAQDHTDQNQRLLLGEKDGQSFVPAVGFGVVDSGRGASKDEILHALWASAGQVDHFGLPPREGAKSYFRVFVDARKHEATVWIRRDGDDQWFLLVDHAPIDPRVTGINAIRVSKPFGHPSYQELSIDEHLSPGREGRPGPPRDDPTVAEPLKAFRVQPMRSTWRDRPGRHVTIARNPPQWMGFPEVVRVGESSLLVVHNDGRQHGGGGGLFIRRSNDLGQTWGDPLALPVTGVNSPRLQILKDGSLLALADLHGPVGVTPLFRSADGGATWNKIGELDATKAGGHAAIVPSRVHEMPDGAWLIAGSWYPGGKPWEGTEGEQLEIYRSTDRGATWKFHAALQAFPDHRHSLSEASFLTLPDGRLMLFAREGRGDGLPGVKAFSADGGLTWTVHELPFSIIGRTHAGFLPDGRVMLTFRSGIGRQALWAWVGDPLEEPRPSAAAGVHFNDAHTVGMARGTLHLDNDGRRGQFTQYFFRPPAEPQTSLDITCEFRVIENQGRAATLSIPFAGLLRLFPERIELETTPQSKHPSIAIQPGEFHTLRATLHDGKLTLAVDGVDKLTTDQLDARTIVQAWTPSRASVYGLAFGNERLKNWGNHDRAVVHPDVWEPNITPEVTGHSLWRRFEVIVTEPGKPPRTISWNAATKQFPDQYQLDHIVEIEASVAGHDQGYSGWTLLPDGRIFVVNYTDDTAPLVRPGTGGGNSRMGISWIRGTWLDLADLPPPDTIQPPQGRGP